MSKLSVRFNLNMQDILKTIIKTHKVTNENDK